jgi:hypothetical protein
MKNKLIVLSGILLILSSGLNNLFSQAHHQCKEQEPDSHCAMNMKKMDCCPVNAAENLCQCSDFNSSGELPEKTAPVVLNTSQIQNSAKVYLAQTAIFLPSNNLEKLVPVHNNLFTALNGFKIYKTINTYLI